MFYEQNQKVGELRHRVQSFMDRHVYPNEERFYKEAEDLGPWQVYPVVEELKPKAREAGLWNLFLPESEHGAGLRQNGSAGALRYPRASEKMAEAAVGRRNPLLFRHDRTGGGLQRRHQY